MRRKHKVIALPTEDASKLHLQKDTKEWLYYSTGEHKGNSVILPHHLYITSDEEIKEGDWYILKIGNDESQPLRRTDCESVFRGDKKRIVATTNPELWTKTPIESTSGHFLNQPLPKIPTDFIEVFAREQGIWEVELEIDNHLPDTDGDFGKPKLRPNGTVIIHPVQEKKFTMKEMVDFVMWYSGMTQEKVVNAYNRYLVEKPE